MSSNQDDEMAQLNLKSQDQMKEINELRDKFETYHNTYQQKYLLSKQIFEEVSEQLITLEKNKTNLEVDFDTQNQEIIKKTTDQEDKQVQNQAQTEESQQLSFELSSLSDKSNYQQESSTSFQYLDNQIQQQSIYLNTPTQETLIFSEEEHYKTDLKSQPNQSSFYKNSVSFQEIKELEEWLNEEQAQARVDTCSSERANQETATATFDLKKALESNQTQNQDFLETFQNLDFTIDYEIPHLFKAQKDKILEANVLMQFIKSKDFLPSKPMPQNKIFILFDQFIEAKFQQDEEDAKKGIQLKETSIFFIDFMSLKYNDKCQKYILGFLRGLYDLSNQAYAVLICRLLQVFSASPIETETAIYLTKIRALFYNEMKKMSKKLTKDQLAYGGELPLQSILNILSQVLEPQYLFTIAKKFLPQDYSQSDFMLFIICWKILKSGKKPSDLFNHLRRQKNITRQDIIKSLEVVNLKIEEQDYTQLFSSLENQESEINIQKLKELTERITEVVQRNQNWNLSLCKILTELANEQDRQTIIRIKQLLEGAATQDQSTIKILISSQEDLSHLQPEELVQAFLQQPRQWIFQVLSSHYPGRSKLTRTKTHN